MSSRTIIVLENLPASGKSTWAMEKLASLPTGEGYLLSCHDYFPIGYNENEVLIRQFRMMEAFVTAVKSGVETIIIEDHEAFMKSRMSFYGQHAFENGYEMTFGSLDREARASCVDENTEERFTFKFMIDLAKVIAAREE